MRNLIDVLNELNVKYCRSGEHHHVRDGWVGVNCPWCPPPRGHKGAFRLGIEINSGRTNCWVCGRHSIASVLVEVAKVPYKTAKGLLSGIRLSNLSPAHVPKPDSKLQRPSGIGPMLPAHRKYLQVRGFNPDKIEKLWNVMGIGIAGSLQWRLYIPITLDGQEVSWTTRSIAENNVRKYISASPNQERLHFKDSLYGIDMVRTTIVVVEGPTDVWRIGPGAVALYGLNYTPSQVALIAKFPWRVICFDNEPDAQKKATRLCNTLSLLPGRTTNIRLDAEDPGSASLEEIKRFRRLVLD